MSEISLQELENKDREVSSPWHYQGDNGIECKDALDAMLGSGYCIQPEANSGQSKNLRPIAFYWWGCAFKYLWRWTNKHGLQDLRKCRQCIDYLIDEVTSHV